MTMAKRCPSAKCCMFLGALSVVFGSCLIILGVVEKFRFRPFYTPLKCTHANLALPMSKMSFPPGNPYGIPAGQPPYGLYGHVADVAQTCDNPNEYDLSTKKTESLTRMYLPNLTNPIDGKPYLEIAQSNLTQDVNLHAKSTTQLRSSIYGSVPLAAFASISAVASMRGYVPLYSKTVATVESCMRFFGVNVCGKVTTESWCGALGGQCLVEVPGTNMTEPAICALTRSVCRVSESEVKSLTTAENLGLTIVAVLPCLPSTGLPNTLNCSIPASPGIDAAMKAQPIPGYVDGPDPRKEDIEKAESAIAGATSLAIALGVFIVVLACILGVCFYLRQKKKGTDATPGRPAPAILTSSGANEKDLTITLPVF